MSRATLNLLHEYISAILQRTEKSMYVSNLPRIHFLLIFCVDNAKEEHNDVEHSWVMDIPVFNALTVSPGKQVSYYRVTPLLYFLSTIFSNC